MRALHVRLTLSFALLLAGLAIGLLVLLSRTSDRYSDEVLQRLNSGIAQYVVQELPPLKGGKVNEVALHELAHRPDVGDYEESALSLEEMYTALLARFHRTAERNGQGSASRPYPVPLQEKGDRQ